MTITFDQALALCRSDPEAAARLICDLSARVDAQQRQIDLLLRKADDLERKVAQLSKNSTNSSKPPSSDITRKFRAWPLFPLMGKSRAWPLSPACFILGGVGIWMVAQNPEVRAAAKYQPGYDGLPESGRKLPP